VVGVNGLHDASSSPRLGLECEIDCDVCVCCAVFIIGSVYVTSPSLFEHGVAYPASDDWADRILAVQSRLLLTAQESKALKKVWPVAAT
jgi:hypothetical protein